MRWQLRFHAYFWPMFFMLWMVYYGVQQIEMEHDFPTPVEWGFWARWEGRSAKALLRRVESRGWGEDDEYKRGAEYLLGLVERLENVNAKEGKGLAVQELRKGDGPLMVDGVGRLGFDVSHKSERWRQGYWECLMELAKVAEHLDGTCKKRGTKLTEKAQLYRWENIPGPDNPRPVPVPWDRNGSHLNVPTIGEVEPALDTSEAFYMRILTSKGFTNRQRLDAALAYADWCDFKGLRDTASNMYDWAIDIAAGGLPVGADHVVDIQSHIINAGKERFVSENLLKATTAVAVWHARHGEVKEALPIFLSVLRARKALPPSPPHLQMQASAPKKTMSAAEREAQTTGNIFLGYFQHFIDFFKEQDSSIPSNGDEQPFHSLKEACEEVGLMTYIGEILFATSENEREKGMSWTRDSVEAAEAVLWFMDEQGSDEDEGRERCRECLETGLSNWQQMTQQMARLARKKEEEAKQSHGWLGLGIGQNAALEKAVEEVKRWKEEETQIELRRKKTASLVSTLRPTSNPYGMVSTI